MKLILSLVAFLVISTSSFARSYGPAGCGLGNMVLEGQSGLVMNVLAATLNGSSGNQTFGMTSGTSNCEVDERTKVSSVVFIEANRVALANDIARGNGETLASLGKIYGCNNQARMNAELQKNYGAIFTADSSAEQINQKITGVITSNKVCI